MSKELDERIYADSNFGGFVGNVKVHDTNEGVEISAGPGCLYDAYLTLLRNALTDTCGQYTSSFHNGQPAMLEITPDHPRMKGLDWPFNAATMVGPKRLDQLRSSIEYILENNIEGNLIECGAWRGGASIFMCAVLFANGVVDRKVYVADSFAGLPTPTAEEDKAMKLHTMPYLCVPLEEVQRNFDRFGFMDMDIARFLRGWFRDTLPPIRGNKWAMIRADGDMYESTMDVLTNLYPDLSPGGVMVLDDFNVVPECKKAVEKYRADNGIECPTVDIDGSGIYWVKEKK